MQRNYRTFVNLELLAGLKKILSGSATATALIRYYKFKHGGIDADEQNHIINLIYDTYIDKKGNLRMCIYSPHRYYN